MKLPEVELLTFKLKQALLQLGHPFNSLSNEAF